MNDRPTSLFYGETKRDGSMLDTIVRIYSWTALLGTTAGLYWYTGLLTPF